MTPRWIELADHVGSDPQNKAARDAVYACELVAAAIATFDFFSWLSKTPAELHTICASLGLTERVADVMLTLFSAMALVERRQDYFSLRDGKCCSPNPEIVCFSLSSRTKRASRRDRFTAFSAKCSAQENRQVGRKEKSRGWK